jgi:hypothetical protein
MPGTRIGQASECFVYWKDPATSDTWGLNFTSPIDAKQFRECCVSNKYHTNKISHIPREYCAGRPTSSKYIKKSRKDTVNWVALNVISNNKTL